jgi:uncharacterized protein (DUF58 family)
LIVPSYDARLLEVSSGSINPVNPPAIGRAETSWLRSPTAEVWAKFLLAIVGLGLAFGAALFSTASGEAGHLWASAILASVALLLAAFVGLVTVPYLARRAALERLRQTFHYEVTRAGIIYVLVTLVIGIAALNTGNNLLYIVVAAMLAAILVSGVVSALVLRGLELEVLLPAQVFAGRAVAGRVDLRNGRRFLPSFSIRVVPARKQKKIRKEWRWEPTTFVFPLSRSSQSQWLRFRDWRVQRVEVTAAAPGIFEGMVYFPYLPATVKLHADLPLLFERRGRYSESSFGVATRFPFAFLTKIRDVVLPREILVYPSVDFPHELADILPLVQGEWESFVRGRGSDLYRIREYLPEDSARHLDWKATAKSGSLKVREFRREDQRKLCIVFDNPPTGLMREDAYERAVSLAASLAWHFSSQDADVSFLVPGRGRFTEVNAFLEELALIQPRVAGAEGKLEQTRIFRELILADTSEYSIMLTARSRDSFPTEWLNRSYFLFLEGQIMDQPERQSRPATVPLRPMARR